MNKIAKHHLDRAAIIYVRQSSVSQVEQNQESQRRQYALADRARDLGWHDIRVIDDDLGRSGAGGVERQGFEKLLGDVCQGNVGGVFAVEASRLARNGHDWHRLLEFCRVVDTLIIDHDGIYDPKHPNDGLVLGLKGTMSEVELSMFRQRSQEAIRQMARRGEYYTRIAEGYVLGADGVLEKDPDEQVRRTLTLVFAKFQELGSARQVYLWFRSEGIKLPRRIGKAGIDFVEATPWLIGRVLKDPVYAGAYAFGRTNQKIILEEGRKRTIKERLAAPEDWQVLIQDHHEGFITWSEYQSNLETLRHNRNQLGAAVRGAARDGKGLLAGLVRCGVCGKKMRVRYGGRSGRNHAAVYYQCTASQRSVIAKQLCSVFGGLTVEQAVVEAVLAALAPVRVEALAEASEQVTNIGSERRRQLELEIERARFEADRCRRQYDAVEPENRLVARNLEQRWNEALMRVDRLQDALAELEPSPLALSGQERDTLTQIAWDLPRLWQHEAAPFDLKKRIVRAVIKEIVVTVEATMLRVVIHWHGGQHSALDLRKRNVGEHRWKTSGTTLELITQLARVMPDKQIAAQLNRMGIKSAKGHSWTRARVGNFRQDNAIANYVPGERQARGELTMEMVAERLGVSYSTVQRMIRRKQLPACQVCPGAPWVIEAKDVDALCAGQARQPGNCPSSPASDQKTLGFTENT